MASTNLYPPTLDTYTNAFAVSEEFKDNNYCRLYFSLSKYSSTTEDIKSIHISIVKQSNGQSVIRKDEDGDGRFRATGILILNQRPKPVEGAVNLYYVDIKNRDIKSGENIGWTLGWIYKIQIRLATVAYDSSIGESAWLAVNASKFSEWSTYSTTKAIGIPRISIPIIGDFDSGVTVDSFNKNKEYVLSVSTLEFSGTYSNPDITETLYSYRLILKDFEDNVLEDSDLLYSNQYYTPNQFYYLFKTELEDTKRYKVILSYSTINKYEDTLNFNIWISQDTSEKTKVRVVTADTIDTIEDEDFVKAFYNETNKNKEFEEGRIGLKLYLADSALMNENLCIRRASSKDNFAKWEDIKIINCIAKKINSLPMIYDYTAESGVWYKYGVQTISTSGYRRPLNITEIPTLREYNFSYLLGEGGRQLKLKFDNVLNSYVYNYSESKTDTIGGQFPFITRNGNMKYRTIPVNGLISFNMDEQELFTSDKDLYIYSDVINAYQERRRKEGIDMYDYKREHDFREKVLEFLYDGKPKLFKSATEGNLIIRLMQITAQPNQTLNRMIYSFTSIGHEIAEATMENYKKYNLVDIGEYETQLENYNTQIGQLSMDFQVGDNIIEKIWERYDFSNINQGGYEYSLKNVSHLSLEFEGAPLKIVNNAGQEMLGNNFEYNGTVITVNGKGSRVYAFDDTVNITNKTKLIVLGCKDNENIYDANGNITNTVRITVDFLYEYGVKPFEEKQISTQTTSKGIGQIFDSFKPGANIYNEIYYKYYFNTTTEYRVLTKIVWTCIEANPGTVFKIQDENDAEPSIFDIGSTGVLNLEDLGTIVNVEYVGVRKSDGSIDTTKNADVLMDYIFYSAEGVYAGENNG